ncbi:hypothetical protein BGY98DRAFT_936208 [Russula aff. rugulosa BPL654]|nr:hypothetical protein BGY98DRAFT_936208 [Russula aff. rugulosa BPL654]
MFAGNSQYRSTTSTDPHMHHRPRNKQRWAASAATSPHHSHNASSSSSGNWYHTVTWRRKEGHEGGNISGQEAERYSDFSPSGFIIFTLNHPRVLVKDVVKMEEGRGSGSARAKSERKRKNGRSRTQQQQEALHLDGGARRRKSMRKDTHICYFRTQRTLYTNKSSEKTKLNTSTCENRSKSRPKTIARGEEQNRGLWASTWRLRRETSRQSAPLRHARRDSRDTADRFDDGDLLSGRCQGYIALKTSSRRKLTTLRLDHNTTGSCYRLSRFKIFKTRKRKFLRGGTGRLKQLKPTQHFKPVLDLTSEVDYWDISWVPSVQVLTRTPGHCSYI